MASIVTASFVLGETRDVHWTPLPTERVFKIGASSVIWALRRVTAGVISGSHCARRTLAVGHGPPR